MFRDKSFHIGTDKSLYKSLFIYESQYWPIIFASRDTSQVLLRVVEVWISTCSKQLKH